MATLTLSNVRTNIVALRSQRTASGQDTAAALSIIQDALDQIARSTNALSSSVNSARVGPVTPSADAPLDASIDSISWAFTAPAADGTRLIRTTINITPPGSGTWAGAHVWLETPGPSGTFRQFDYGKQVAGATTLVIDHPPPAANETWRYYVGAFSADIDDPLIRVGGLGATPSLTIAATPFTGTAGSEYCANVTGLSITLTFTNTADGQLRRFIQVGFTPPADSRYSGALIELADTASPVHILDSVDGYTDGTVNFEEPGATTNWHVRVRAIGALGTNSYVNGITPEVTQGVGTATGTLDFRLALAASIAAHLGVTSGVFGVLPGGITNALVGAAAIDTINLVNLAVGNSKIAPFAVDAAKIALASIGNAQIDRATVNKLAVVDADIVNLSANKLTAGTIAATIAYLGTLNANQVNTGTLNGVSLVLNLNGITTSVNNGFDANQSAFAGFRCTDGTKTTVVTNKVFAVYGSGGGVASLNFSLTPVLSLAGTTGNSVTLNGGAGTVAMNGNNVLNSSGQYIGNGVLCVPGSSPYGAQGIAGSGFNPYDVSVSTQLFGQNYDLRAGVTVTGTGFFAVGFSINNFASFVSGIRVRGGAITGLF